MSLRTEWRTTPATTSGARPRAAHRLGRARPGPRRPGDLSDVARRAARDRHPQPLTAAGRDPRMSGNCELGRGLRRREKNANKPGAGCFEKPAPCTRAAPAEAHESLISRKTVSQVPLTGLSLAARGQSPSMAFGHPKRCAFHGSCAPGTSSMRCSRLFVHSLFGIARRGRSLAGGVLLKAVFLLSRCVPPAAGERELVSPSGEPVDF